MTDNRNGSGTVRWNGLDLAVEDRGEGRVLLLVHGFPLDRALWRHLSGALPGWRTIAPDLSGFGRSTVPDGGYSTARWADELAGLLEAMEVDRAVVCGLSMGGYIALEFAARHRARMAGLVLMDTRAEADTAEGRAGRDEMIALVRTAGVGAVADRLLPRLLAPATMVRTPEVVQEVRAMIERCPVDGVVGALAAMRDRPDRSALLPTLTGMPVLVVVGAEDAITPESTARAMADVIPGARLEVIAGAGHLPPLERPEAVAGVMAEQ